MILRYLGGIISIHALREEGDSVTRRNVVHLADFYPRPPRGGRRDQVVVGIVEQDFYPRPPRGGRLTWRGQKSRSC